MADPDPARMPQLEQSLVHPGRPQVEQDLQASQDRLRSVIKGVPMVLWAMDPKGTITFSEGRGLSKIGLVPGQVVGQSIFDLNAGREDILAYMRRALAGEEVISILAADEQIYETHYSPQFNADGQLTSVIAVSLLITERSKAEQALKESEERFRSIVNNSLDGILLTAPDGSIFSANAAACSILGWTEQEICQLGREGVVETSDPRVANFIEERKNTGCAMGELTLIRKGGLRFPAEVTSSVFTDKDGNMRTSMIIRDITERKQVEKVLKEKEELLEQRVEQRTRELSALLEVSKNVAATQDLASSLNLILKLLKTVVDYTGAGIVLVEDEHYLMLEYQGPMPREQMVGARFPIQQPDGYQVVLEKREPFIIQDIWGDDAWMRNVRNQNIDAMQTHFQYAHSWLGIPLIAEDKLIGVLRLDHTQPDHFTNEHARLANGFAEQAALAIEKTRLYKQAQELAALEERQKLARELHDSVSQALYGIALGAQTARKLLDSDPLKAKESVDFCLSLAEAGLAEMRALIFELRPESLQEEGLVAALTKQADSLRSRLNIAVHTQFCKEPPAPLDTKQVFFRITQEALQNIIKHAHASEVHIRLDHDTGNLRLTVQDNGKGFDTEGEYVGHLGLKSMRERAKKHGASFKIQSSIHFGTVIEVELGLNIDGNFRTTHSEQ